MPRAPAKHANAGAHASVQTAVAGALQPSAKVSARRRYHCIIIIFDQVKPGLQLLKAHLAALEKFTLANWKDLSDKVEAKIKKAAEKAAKPVKPVKGAPASAKKKFKAIRKLERKIRRDLNKLDLALSHMQQ